MVRKNETSKNTEPKSSEYSKKILKAIEAGKRQGIKECFPTYDEAIDEIIKLRNEMRCQKLAYALATHKKSRGRPKKKISTPSLSFALLGYEKKAKKMEVGLRSTVTMECDSF